MISIADMRNIATAEKEAEKKAKEAKFQKDFAMCRDKIRKFQPQIEAYIQDQIIYAMKNNWSSAKLYRYGMEQVFENVLSYPAEAAMIGFFLWSPDSEAHSALDAAFKEMALEIREELIKAGVKEFHKGGPCMGDPKVIITF